MLLRRVENIVAKGKIAHHEQFHLWSQCFQKLSATIASKCVRRRERVKPFKYLHQICSRWLGQYKGKYNVHVCLQMKAWLLNRIENIVTNGKVSHFELFFLLSVISKVVYMWERVKDNVHHGPNNLLMKDLWIYIPLAGKVYLKKKLKKFKYIIN